MTDLDDFATEFRARGLHVEAAFVEICLASMPRGASREQFTAMRMMFFCGAGYMYDVIMKIADARNGEKASREDLEFLNQLCRELGEFAQKTVLENETAGNA
jgi:hypothetical protein